MNTVTIPRELAQSLLVLMTRSVTDGSHSVPAGQWLTFANALDRAMHASGASEVAAGATPAPSPTPGACRFCRVALSEDQGLCATCASELLHDAQQLEQSRHADCPCSRCQS